MALETPDGFERGVQVQLEKEVWGRIGCREFFQNLNFEPIHRDREFRGSLVTLTSPVVKLDRKMLHFATTAIMAVFGESFMDLSLHITVHHCQMYYSAKIILKYNILCTITIDSDVI